MKPGHWYVIAHVWLVGTILYDADAWVRTFMLVMALLCFAFDTERGRP